MLPQWISEAHVMVFGLLVIFVIRYMANGIVGDWTKIAGLWSRDKQLSLANGGK